MKAVEYLRLKQSAEFSVQTQLLQHNEKYVNILGISLNQIVSRA